jgi:hypothetical protein
VRTLKIMAKIQKKREKKILFYKKDEKLTKKEYQQR